MITWVGIRSPSFLTPLMKFTTNPSSPDYLDPITFIKCLSLFSYASTIASLITSLPALASGLTEGFTLAQANGFDKQNPKIKTLAMHALLNEIALLATLYNWWSRSKSDGHLISNVNAFISTVLFGAIGYSAFLGGSLVYRYGVAVGRHGSEKAVKQKVTKETEEEGKN